MKYVIKFNGTGFIFYFNSEGENDTRKECKERWPSKIKDATFYDTLQKAVEAVMDNEKVLENEGGSEYITIVGVEVTSNNTPTESTEVAFEKYVIRYKEPFVLGGTCEYLGDTTCTWKKTIKDADVYNTLSDAIDALTKVLVRDANYYDYKLTIVPVKYTSTYTYKEIAL